MQTISTPNARQLRALIYTYYGVTNARQLRKLDRFSGDYDLRRKADLKRLWDECQAATADMQEWWTRMYSFNQHPAFQIAA